jgi:hypothetical protein
MLEQGRELGADLVEAAPVVTFQSGPGGAEELVKDEPPIQVLRCDLGFRHPLSHQARGRTNGASSPSKPVRSTLDRPDPPKHVSLAGLRLAFMLWERFS